MIASLRRKTAAYSAMAAIVPKIYLAYSLWVWVSLLLNTIALAILVFFWQAVYSNTTDIAGLDLQTTLNYIILAQIFYPLAEMALIFEFGYNLREGGIAHALLRPLDFQLGNYVQYQARLISNLILQIPLAIVALVLFKLELPTDPAAWAAFLVTALLGRTILFFFDYILACLTFYTTEVWGLGVLVFGAGLFFSGSLIPLTMLPLGLEFITYISPWAQALYAPLSLLLGIQPLDAAPRIWLIQAGMLLGLGLASRLVFKHAVRKITVQGG
jgi:ABC-2 type transport system permease protein